MISAEEGARERAAIALTPAMIYVLLAVADEPRHGYAIMQEIARESDGTLELLPGSLYTTIKRLGAAGLIEECVAPAAGDPRRRFYRITAEGRQAARQELARMSTAVEIGRRKRVAP